MLPQRSNLTHALDKNEFLTPFSTIFDELFNNSLSSLNILGKGFFDNASYPKVDVLDHEKEIVIEAEIPGLKKNQISVEIDNNKFLRIKGEKNQTSTGNKYLHRELKHSSFCRTFQIPSMIDVDKITSSFEDGILKVRLPKNEEVESSESTKKIKIE